MKKAIAKVLTLLLCLCTLICVGTACKHEHVFNQQVVTDDYILYSAACAQKAVYYYSCECGEKGEETFEYGELYDHVYENGKCKICGDKEPSVGLSYTLINDGTEYEVTGIGDCTDIDIVIPSMYLGKLVTCIGYKAFKSCNSLVSIKISKSVTSIEDRAFSNCKSLISVDIPNSVKNMDGVIFENCDSLAYNMKDGLKYLGNSNNPYLYLACTENTSVTTVTIDNNCKFIGGDAFSWCESLETIEIPNSVTSIGDHAFSLCKSLASIEIPNSVTRIGDSAFCNCDQLVSVTFGEKSRLTSIGNSAFYDCYSLTRIEIPSGVTSIEHLAFNGCRSLTNITIPDSLVDIGDCFWNHSSLTYNVKDGLKYLGNSNNPYLYLAGVESNFIITATIDNNCKFIGARAFRYCELLKTITIPDGVISIGNSAFGRCTSLASIEIPNSVIEIDSHAFSGCTALKKVNYKGTVDEWAQKIVFYGEFANPLNYIGDLYINNEIVTDIVLTTTKIEAWAFYNCDSLTSVTISDSVTNLRGYVFAECDSLTSITIQNGITCIYTDTFYSCYSLKSIVIPKSVTIIEGHPFRLCPNLTIYCEAESKPDGWDLNWNSDCPVVWGYKGN